MNLVNNLYLRFTFGNSIQNWNNVERVNKATQYFYIYPKALHSDIPRCKKDIPRSRGNSYSFFDNLPSGTRKPLMLQQQKIYL